MLKWVTKHRASTLAAAGSSAAQLCSSQIVREALLTKTIAYIYTDFPQKFGIPRQSGLIEELTGHIVFEPEYRSADAVRGLEGFDYIWLLWKFEGTQRPHPSPTVTPPRLGGKTAMGVFATRSPFRPNPIGLSSVRLRKISLTNKGPVLHVSGADLRNKTPIYDIKPYLPYTDSHPDARDGFASAGAAHRLRVSFPPALLAAFPPEKQSAALALLEQDPRPAYQHDGRIYGVAFAGHNIRFTVQDDCLTVLEVTPFP